MGWTTLPKPSNVSQWLTDQFSFKSADGEVSHKVLDCAIVSLRTAYLAVEITKGDEVDYAAFVILLEYMPKEHYSFGYKPLDESMGPYQREAPRRILELIGQSEPINEHARDWRAGCWKNLENRKSRKLKKVEGTRLVPKDPQGLKLREADPAISEFTVTWTFTRRGKKQIVLSGGGSLWKITGWLLDQLEIAE